MATPTPTPRQKLDAAKARYQKAVETFGKAQASYAEARQEFKQSVTGTTAGAAVAPEGGSND